MRALRRINSDIIDSHTYYVYNVYMRYYDWDTAKNEWLKRTRGVCFEEAVMLIASDNLLDIIGNSAKYPSQRIFVLNIEGYAYLVPFVEDGQRIFLKTIFPSRKATGKYIKNKHD